MKNDTSILIKHKNDTSILIEHNTGLNHVRKKIVEKRTKPL